MTLKTDKPDSTRKEYDNAKPIWELVDNICDGKNLDQYIVEMNPDDDSKENKTRNQQFKKRANFSEIAGYTINGLLGLVFGRDPDINLPKKLQYLLSNVDGTGVGIVQQCQDTTENLLRLGRCGLWVDYPTTNGIVTQEDINQGKVFATINMFHPTSIINWHTTTRGSKVILSMVMLAYNKEEVGDYQVSYRPGLIELRLINDVYTVQRWLKNDKEEWVKDGELLTPTKSDGNAFEEIPFAFGGSKSNTWRIDKAPMHRIARLNVGHYNNSAIYEDAVFTLGQPQYWMSGMSEEHVKMLQKYRTYVGSGHMMAVPPKEQMGVVQAQPNTLAKEAKDDKVQEMIGLGAMFIMPGSAVKTATQSGGEQKMQHSVLSLVSTNARELYEKALEWVSDFMGIELSEDQGVDINNDFLFFNNDSNMLNTVMTNFLKGALPPTDYHDFLKKAGMTDPEKTLEDFMAELTPPSSPDLEPEDEEDADDTEQPD